MNIYWFGAFIIWSMFMVSIGYEGKGWKDGKNEAEVAIVQQKDIIAAENNVILKERLDNQKTNEVSSAYETKISAIDNQYNAAVDGVRGGGNTTSNSVSNISQSVPGNTTTANRNELSQQDKTILIKLAKQADIQTARLVACQTWVKEQSK